MYLFTQFSHFYYQNNLKLKMCFILLNIVEVRTCTNSQDEFFLYPDNL